MQLVKYFILHTTSFPDKIKIILNVFRHKKKTYFIDKIFLKHL